MYRGYHKIAPWIPGREPWRRSSSTRSDGVVTTCVSEQQQDGNHTVGEMERQLLLMLQGVTRQVILAMDGEGDLVEVKQFLSLLPAYTDEEADKQMMSMIQGVGRQAMRAMGCGLRDRRSMWEFLSSLRGFSYVGGDGLITDLMLTMARRMSFQNIVDIVSSNHSPGMFIVHDIIVKFILQA